MRRTDLSRRAVVWSAALLLALLAGLSARAAEPQAPQAPQAPQVPTGGEQPGDAMAREAQRTQAIAAAVARSIVRVEYELQFDKGEAPRAGGWSERCPNCGNYHGNNTEQVVGEERPVEAAGLVLSRTRVLTADPMIHARFVKQVAVRDGGRLVPAKVAAYVRDQAAVILELAEPLKEAEPLSFDAARKGPYYAVTASRYNGEWTTSVRPLAPTVTSTESGRRFIAVPSYCLIADAAGGPVGASMKDEVPADDSWKGSPERWDSVSAADLEKALDAVRKRLDAGLLRATLNFRSPKASNDPMRRFGPRGGMGGGDEEDALVRHANAVLIDPRTALVLVELQPAITARLQRIRLFDASGKPRAATFLHTLRDYGAFLARLDQPADDAAVVALAGDGPTAFRNRLLPAAEVRLQGESRTVHLGHQRIASFNVGWRRQLYPVLPGGAENVLLFDPAGALLAVPIARREPPTLERRWSRSSSSNGLLTAVAYLKPLLADPAAHADAGNVPLSEEQENRLAWLGVELQGLNRELARANGVSHLTNDGETGALVTFVYPGSPAAQAGIEPGHILLRLHVDGQPAPLQVKIEEYESARGPIPWDRWDELPEQYFDQIPTPWPPAETSLTRALTDLGFGRRFSAELFHDGKPVRKQMAVTESPAHYESAPRHKDPAMGLTVREITYEARRYFQMKEDDPGVLISKVEMGSKASVAGIKPYELITHVNDAPVKTVKDFEKLVKGQTDLRLSVKRMSKGRLVKLTLAAGGRAADAKPAE